ncbi:MAG: hypothetical protein JW795_16630, partial [Chitinivibrionales bacterium]|nr:hypothetical protein [Chitinivibrionales bacterium]
TTTADSFRTPTLSGLDTASTYYYIVSNKAGADTSRHAILRVDLNLPVVTTHPQNKTVQEGKTATFTVNATGTGIGYLWHRNGVALVDTNAAKKSYTTPPVAFADSGAAYTCVVSNRVGSDTSNAAVLSVTKQLITILTQPVSDTVLFGDTAVYKISVSSLYPPVTFQWQRRPSATGSAFASIAGATDSIYSQIVDVDSLHNTRYRCIVADGAGARTSDTARLVILYPAPVILADPVGLTVAAKDTATFKISVSGRGTLSFTWQQQDTAGTITAISTAIQKDSIYKRRTALSDSGKKYRCIVSNSGGKDTSAFALLIVTSNTSISTLFISQKNSPLFVAGPAPAIETVTFCFLGKGAQKGVLKIYDPVGNIVYENNCMMRSSEKAIAIWNCTNKQGKRVSSGSYLALLKMTTVSGKVETYSRTVGVKE